MRPALLLSLVLPLAGASSALADDEALRAQALLATLNAELLSRDSATATLQRWCELRGLAPGQPIVARRQAGPPVEPGPEVLAALGAAPGEAIRHRRVSLTCGAHVLSIADNWYRPSRLTPEMNRALADTETPFGVVVAPLGFRRRTLSVDVLFQPLPEGWEAGGDIPAGSPAIPDHILRHRAVLTDASGAPFSVVEETYTSAAIAPR